jgi:hypothetical protein
MQSVRDPSGQVFMSLLQRVHAGDCSSPFRMHWNAEACRTHHDVHSLLTFSGNKRIVHA